MRRSPRPERTPRVPAEVVTAAGFGGRDRLLAAAAVPPEGSWLLAGTLTLALVDGRRGPTWRRAWHEIDRASWDREPAQLTVTWVDGTPPSRWPLAGAREFLLVLRERVQASVVAVQTVPLPGRRTARAVLRLDLATRAPFEQLLPGPGGRLDPSARAATEAAFARLWDDIGIPPQDRRRRASSSSD
ncbi:MAG: hypothetical protein V9F82_07955 [Dermatophilaceae bacterium]